MSPDNNAFGVFGAKRSNDVFVLVALDGEFLKFGFKVEFLKFLENIVGDAVERVEVLVIARRLNGGQKLNIRVETVLIDGDFLGGFCWRENRIEYVENN